MSFNNFQKKKERAEEVLDVDGDALSLKQKASLKVDVRQFETLKMVRAVTGRTLGVLENATANIGGVTETATLKMAIAKDVLKDPKLALDVAWHEIEHVETDDFFTMDEKLYLEGEDLKAVEDEFAKYGISMKSIRWYEGFTEHSKAHKHGKNGKCGYNACDVPAVEKLEELCKDFTGESLLDAFKARNLLLFKERLRGLSAMIRASEILEKLAA